MKYKVRFFDPGKSYLSIKPEIDAEMQRVLAAGDLMLRDDVEKFEHTLAEYVGTKYAVALNSGTDALFLALKALGIGNGHRVAVPSHTFVATAQVVPQVGAEIVQYDLDGYKESNTLIDCWIVAHIAGELNPVPSNQFVPVIEDACQALGAVQHPQSDIQCWSFYPAKILGCYGDAGAITTDREDLYQEIHRLRNHYNVKATGMAGDSQVKKFGYNSRLDNLQAAVLNVKFKYLPVFLFRRQVIAERYSKALAGVGDISLPFHGNGRVWQDYILWTSRRDELHEFLKDKGIETLKNEYPWPIRKMPDTVQYEAMTLRLPCNEVIEDSQVEYVIKQIKKFYAR